MIIMMIMTIMIIIMIITILMIIMIIIVNAHRRLVHFSNSYDVSHIMSCLHICMFES